MSKTQAEKCETIQNHAARQLLGTPQKTSTDMMRELGWIRLEARRHRQVLQLVFHRLQAMPAGKLAKEVFCEGLTTTRQMEPRHFGRAE